MASCARATRRCRSATIRSSSASCGGADQPTGPSNSFTGALHFLDALGSETALIDHFTEFEAAFDLDSATASTIPSSFNSALDDFESARGNELLRASGGDGLGGDTGAGGKTLALADVLSGFESDSEAEVLQLFEVGPGSAVRSRPAAARVTPASRLLQPSAARPGRISKA
jgi:hypothetical protein